MCARFLAAAHGRKSITALYVSFRFVFFLHSFYYDIVSARPFVPLITLVCACVVPYTLCHRTVYHFHVYTDDLILHTIRGYDVWYTYCGGKRRKISEICQKRNETILYVCPQVLLASKTRVMCYIQSAHLSLPIVVRVFIYSAFQCYTCGCVCGAPPFFFFFFFLCAANTLVARVSQRQSFLQCNRYHTLIILSLSDDNLMEKKNE